MPRRDTAITSADTSPHRGCVRACSGKLERERKNKREREEDTHLIWGAMIGRVRITVRHAAHRKGPCPSRIHIHNVRCVSGSYWTLTLQCLGTGRKNKKEMAEDSSVILWSTVHITDRKRFPSLPSTIYDTIRWPTKSATSGK